MTMLDRLALRDMQRPLLAGAGYLFALAALIVIGAVSCVGLWRTYADYTEAVALRDELRGRKGLAGLQFTTPPPAGSPYLEGPTATVASAALQQRIATLVSDAGGSVLSSESDSRDPGADDGRISLVVSCDIDQNGLQRVLYEIEAGMPVLFVDKLTIQAGQSDEGAGAGHVRAQIALSGQWRASQ